MDAIIAITVPVY